MNGKGSLKRKHVAGAGTRKRWGAGYRFILAFFAVVFLVSCQPNPSFSPASITENAAKPAIDVTGQSTITPTEAETSDKTGVEPAVQKTEATEAYLPIVTKAGSVLTNGPLHVSPDNPRYFADQSGKIVYLTGSHTWSNLQDNGGSYPPPSFDYTAYLNFLTQNHHNFFRLWSWEQSRWTVETADNNYWFDPMPYTRTGPGNALDGKAKFDLTEFNQAYFDRMRQQIIQASERGIYVSVMLFDGWSVQSNKGGFGLNNPWKGHPFNSKNNINQISGDTNNNNNGEEVHTLSNPAVTAFQEAYVRKVIDTVNDLDNVLYEIGNEGNTDSTDWQYHMIGLVKQYEATKPKQHPVGMTAQWPDGNNNSLYESEADWISPNGDINNPSVSDGRKVVLYDSDHLCGICGDRSYVWKSFTNGLNPIFMDGYDGAGYGVGGVGFDFNNPTWVNLRANLGYALMYAEKMNLAKMIPQGNLCSTGYCLAYASASGAEFLVYAPNGGNITVNLKSVQGGVTSEWLNPENGQITVDANKTTTGGTYSFKPPFPGDAVLYLHGAN